MVVPETPFHLCIVYPTDPLGDIPGGIDTYIRGVVRWAPEDFRVSVIGVTTAPDARPPMVWSRLAMNGRPFDFFPLFEYRNPQKQHRIPLSLRFTIYLASRMPPFEADLLEFHRIEPSLALFRDSRRKSLVIHQHREVLRDNYASIRWKYAPGIFYQLERILIPRMSLITCVREDAANAYKAAYPTLSDRFRFRPTWMDPEIFSPPTSESQTALRAGLRRRFGFHENDRVLVTVGRLDPEKNPLLLLKAFERVRSRFPDARLLYVGDGVLAPKLHSAISRSGLDSAVKITGLMSREDVAQTLRGADLFVLSSAYECMPMSMLEALGTGLPVISTAVGEIVRVIEAGRNGALVPPDDADGLAEAITRVLSGDVRYRSEDCIRSVSEFTPGNVLADTFERYRSLLETSPGPAK